MAALHFPRDYQSAMCHVRNDAMRDPIFPWTFSRRIAMEPIRVRGSLRRDCVRHIRSCNSHGARAATADPSFHAACENVFACLSHLGARAELDLFAAALAQFLAIKEWRLPSRQSLNRRLPEPSLLESV